jgi:hypothetical protein
MAKTDPADLPPPEVEEWAMPLRKPVQLGDMEPITSILLREPTGAEWLLWEKLTGVEANIKAISTVAGVPEQVVGKLGTRAIVKAAAFLERFF